MTALDRYEHAVAAAEDGAYVSWSTIAADLRREVEAMPEHWQHGQKTRRLDRALDCDARARREATRPGRWCDPMVAEVLAWADGRLEYEGLVAECEAAIGGDQAAERRVLGRLDDDEELQIAILGRVVRSCA